MDVIIEAGRSEKNYWRDVWMYRELFYILAWRDIKVRYKQTVIGAAWSILRPLLTMFVFTIVFSKVAGLQSPEGIAYPILVYVAMLPWYFFSSGLAESSNSLIGNANLITKVYFPRIIIPFSSVVVSFVDFCVSFLVLLLLYAYYGVLPTWTIVFLPIFLILNFVLTFGAGLILTTLNVKYRDFRYIIPFIIQFGLYVSPVGFQSSIVPSEYRLYYNLNPMVGIIEGFRWCLLPNTYDLDTTALWSSAIWSVVLLYLGLTLFRKHERKMADQI